MTLEETLRAFTAGSAHAAFDEDRLGVLKVGMRADVTVVDRDLFQVEPLDLLEAKVLMTVVDGEVVVRGEDPSDRVFLEWDARSTDAGNVADCPGPALARGCAMLRRDS